MTTKQRTLFVITFKISCKIDIRKTAYSSPRSCQPCGARSNVALICCCWLVTLVTSEAYLSIAESTFHIPISETFTAGSGALGKGESLVKMSFFYHHLVLFWVPCEYRSFCIKESILMKGEQNTKTKKKQKIITYLMVVLRQTSLGLCIEKG